MNGRQSESTIRWGAPRPEIVCLCGSTRFKEQIQAAGASLTMEGVIVVAPMVFGHVDMPDVDWSTGATDVKRRLDELHFRKIDLCDRIVVVNVDGYVGESTAREIAYARSRSVRVDYLYERTVEAGPELPTTWPVTRVGRTLIVENDPDGSQS
jgi:hypothetical protein